MPMRSRLPGLADAAIAVAMAGVLYYLALRVRLWEDFYVESAPAVRALIAGRLHSFLTLAPVYGGSLLLQAPASLLGGAIAGLDGAYRFGSLFCIGALCALALCLARLQRADGRRLPARLLAIAVVVANPAASWALKEGHPEEILAAAMCVGGMLLLLRGRVSAAAILLGLAVATKQWALLALPLAFVAAAGERLRFSILAGASAALLAAPMALANAGRVIATNRGLSASPDIFHPQQIWWALHLYYMRPLGGPTSTIFGPSPVAFVAGYSHPLIVLCAVLLALAYWSRRRRVEPSDALLMLALVLLVRCMLDPWNVIYYQFPFLLCLAAWEIATRRRAPLLALLASGLVWLSFRPVNLGSSGDATDLFYLTWALPAALLMLWRSLRLPRPRPLDAIRRLPHDRGAAALARR